jgi:hypothetical protein
MRNRLLFAIPLTIILGGLLLLHVYWALGGRWGSASTVPTVNGRRSFDPSPLAIWVVCGLLGLAVIIVMGKSGWIAPGPLPVLFDAGVWGLGKNSYCGQSELSAPSASLGRSKARPLPIGTPGSIRRFACYWRC